MTPDDVTARPTPFQRAKDTLLNALEKLQKAEEDLGREPERVHLVVTYEVGVLEDDGAWHSIGGWAATPGSKWEHAALLHRAANAQDDVTFARDDDDESEDDD